jgi:hypothetical protein
LSSRPACSAARRRMDSTAAALLESRPRAARSAAMAPAWMKRSAVGVGRVASSTGRSPPAVQASRSGAMGACPCDLVSGAGVEESTACTSVQRVLAGITGSDSIRAQAAERAVRASVLNAALGNSPGVPGGRGFCCAVRGAKRLAAGSLGGGVRSRADGRISSSLVVLILIPPPDPPTALA